MHTLAHFAMWLCITFAGIGMFLGVVLSAFSFRQRQHNGDVEVLNWNIPCVFGFVSLLWSMGALALVRL